ncbi:MAG TPA: hypothetical protein VGJ46_11315 [Candidatus Limnocylindrales bacterium]|jgi:hypothetical protein
MHVRSVDGEERVTPLELVFESDVRYQISSADDLTLKGDSQSARGGRF